MRPAWKHGSRARELRHFRARTERLARRHGISVKLAARMVRDDDLLARKMVRAIRRDLARAVRP